MPVLNWIGKDAVKWCVKWCQGQLPRDEVIVPGTNGTDSIFRVYKHAGVTACAVGEKA